MNELYSLLRKEDDFLNHLFGENKDDYLNIFYLINRIINNIKEDTIIVTPNKREFAYITSIYSSLNFFYKNYQNQFENFEQWLKPGQNVSLVSSGKQTGVVFKYLGREKNEFKLETVPKTNKKKNYSKTIITQKIETILQFAPTSRTINKGNVKDIAFIPKNLSIPEIDKFLKINSFKNPILYENKIILLNNSVERFENFYSSEILNKNNIDYNINELISFGSIEPGGNIEGAEVISEDKIIEKNIIVTSNTSNIYNYLSRNNNKKIIIGSEIKKISNVSNFLQYSQIKNLKNRSNFLIFADDNDFEEIKELKKKTSINVFKLFNKDLIPFNTSEKVTKKIFNAGNEIINDIKTKINKNVIDINVGNETFERIDQCFDNINLNLFNEDEGTKEDIKTILTPINNLRFRLRDHIFGFEKELSDDFNLILKDFSSELKSRQNQFSHKIYDNLAKIVNLFNTLPKDGLNIFEDRVKNFHEILKINNPIDTIIYSYNLERKKYYEDNIKKRFNLEFKAITSKNSKKRYKNLIIPSEIISKDIIKLINNSNYENLYFLGSNNLIRKINIIKDDQINKWKSLIIDENKKIKLLNIDIRFKDFLLNESIIVKNTPQNINGNVQNIEEFLFDNGNDIDFKDDNNVEKVVPTIPIKLYGDRHVYLTENFDTEILNPILDPYSFKREKIKKDAIEIVEDDILLLRDSSDQDILDKETLLLYNRDLNFKEFKNIALGLEGEIIKSFGITNPFNDNKSINLTNLKNCLKKNGYKGSSQTIRLIASGITGCPDDIDDLKKILKACEINCPDNYKYDIDLVNKIYSYNRLYKNLRIQAGRNITPKIYNALRANPDISFDGDPLRVDYNNDGSISLGLDTSEKPEAWIVQVQKTYGEKRVNKNYNSTNTLI